MKRMNSIIIFALVAMLGLNGCAKPEINVKFDSEEHNFGKIKEEDGPVSHTFTFTNHSSEPVVIESVKSSCGCTTPAYDREPIKFRSSGNMEIRFNPERYSGITKKNVTVVFNNGKQKDTVTLNIVADIVPRPPTVEEEFPMTLEDGLRVTRLHIPMGYVHHGTVVSDTIVFINTSDKAAALGIKSASGSGLLKADIPAVVMPGERAQAIVNYDFTNITTIYGPVADRIFLTVNGKEFALPVNANAIAVDNFEGVDPESAPKLRFNPGYFNFGESRRGEVLSGETTVYNTGKLPLIIRDVSTRKNTGCSLTAGTVIEPGEKITVTVTMKVPSDANGTVSGSVTIISNDPIRPQRELRTAAEVEENSKQPLR